MSSSKEEAEATKALILSLHTIGAIKFGSFKLKSGINSPIYFDFRLIISHPEILKQISGLIWTIMTEKNLKYDTICGVPYTAVPIATVLSVEHGVPMILKRKEQKKYGTGNMLEGTLTPDSLCLILEDVVTTGSSVIDTAYVIRAHGIKVTDVIAILNREQGAEPNLQAKEIKLHSILHVHQLLEFLQEMKLITPSQLESTEHFFHKSKRTAAKDLQVEAIIKYKLISRVSSNHSKSLLRIMLKKQSNLALSADLHNFQDVIAAVDQLGEYICLVKLHSDLLNFESYEQVLTFRRTLQELAKTHSFMIMEDRKFADIGAIVQKQLTAKPFEYEKLAHFVTVHGLSGPGVLKGISSSFPHLGIVLIAEMSTEGHLMSPEYKNAIFSMAKGYEEYVSGFVSQSRPTDTDGQFLQFAPGVSLNIGWDPLGQRYTSVENAIERRGADVIIVGRGILNEAPQNWSDTAAEFKSQGWASWRKRLIKEEKEGLL